MIHLNEVRATVKQGVELVAVSKFHPAALIKEAYDQGQRIFGESRVQELQTKHEAYRPTYSGILSAICSPIK